MALKLSCKERAEQRQQMKEIQKDVEVRGGRSGHGTMCGVVDGRDRGSH